MVGVNTTRCWLPAGIVGSSSTVNVPWAGVPVPTTKMLIEPDATPPCGRLELDTAPPKLSVIRELTNTRGQVEGVTGTPPINCQRGSVTPSATMSRTLVESSGPSLPPPSPLHP